MRTFLFLLGIFFIMGCKEKTQPTYASTDLFHLAAPQITASKVLFQNTSEIRMRFAMEGAIIKYTIDGSEVTEQSTNYSQPIILDQSATIKAKSFHTDYQESLTAEIQVRKFRKNIHPASISITPEPNEKYKGEGAKSLIDHEKGTLQFSNDAWLGYQTETVTANLEFSEPKKVEKIIISTMSNHGSWIFLPESISIESENKIVGKVTLKTPSESESNSLHYIEIPIEKRDYRNLKIIVSPLGNIPNWHPGKDTPAWFFVDEILIE